MRRRTVLQRIQQEAEFLTLFLFVNAQNTKYGLLLSPRGIRTEPPPTS